MTAARPRPPPGGFLWWTLRAQWAWGLLPLAFLTEVSRAAILVSAAAFIAGIILDRTGTRSGILLRASTPLTIAAAAAAAADFMVGSRDLLYSVSVLILGIQAVKLLLPKGVRDGWQLSAISFLEFAAAAASTSEIQFATFALTYICLCAGAMWRLQAEGDMREGDAAPPPVRPAFAAKILLFAASAGILFTTVLFLITPRIGIGHLLRSFRKAEGISGFSETISLREVTGVKSDRRVAARIEFPGQGDRAPAGLYLRGAAYSLFDGKTWTRALRSPRRLQRIGSYYNSGTDPPGARQSEAEIFLEAMDNPAIFVYGNPLYIEGTLGDLWTEGDGSFSLGWSGHSALRYRVVFSPGAPQSFIEASTLKQYLQLPPGFDDLRDLSARVIAGGKTDAERAELAVRHFSTGYRYTLTDPAASVRDFIFTRKAGFCEHYATALALLLRAAGIPSRLAAGYLGGEWSDPGKYLIVRQSDAHAWTEAWIDGRWVTLDATPHLGEQSPFFARTGRAGIYLDWMRQRWDKYVINYSLKMQAEGVVQGWGAVAGIRRGIARAISPPGGFRPASGMSAVMLFALIAAAALLRKFLERGKNAAHAAGDGSKPLPRPYAKLLRRLAAAGFRESPGTTMENMLRSAVLARPGLAGDASRFIPLYHRDRFGAFPLTLAEAREAGRLASRLRRGIGRDRAV